MVPKLKFAVVREDPRIEAELVRKTSAQQALVVASGGCTALGLLEQFPKLNVTAFDLNPLQLTHVLDKLAAAARGELRMLNVGDPREDGLSQRGDFERLFRVLRSFLLQFVAPEHTLEKFFSTDPEIDRAALVRAWSESPHWPLAFSLTFAPELLNVIFGPEATRHAPPGSYAGYFQRAFESALGLPNAPANPFLQHILLGCYRSADAPPWIRSPPTHAPALIEGSLLEVPELERFEVISLSNVFDWSSDELVAQWAQRLTEQTKPGTHVVVRQLNNRRELRSFFEPGFRFDDRLAEKLLLKDRSFFYERLQIAVKT
jgi:S-adenosylmethionine-diacylglycerol 3-amino-3-carboxypropyl transferase